MDASCGRNQEFWSEDDGGGFMERRKKSAARLIEPFKWLCLSPCLVPKTRSSAVCSDLSRL